MARRRGNPPPPKKMGRPRKFDDEKWEELLGYLKWNLTLGACKGLLDVDEHTLYQEIESRTGKTFSEFREQMADRGVRLTLYRKIMDGALEGNTALMIFAAKNILGWSDNNHAIPSSVDPKQIQIHWQDEVDDAQAAGSAKTVCDANEAQDSSTEASIQQR